MFTTKPTGEWNSDDAKSLRDFLDSGVGVKAIALIAEECPSLGDGSDVNKTLVTSGEVKGFQNAIRELFELTSRQPEQPKPAEPYPSLDEEQHWK